MYIDIFYYMQLINLSGYVLLIMSGIDMSLPSPVSDGVLMNLCHLNRLINSAATHFIVYKVAASTQFI